MIKTRRKIIFLLILSLFVGGFLWQHRGDRKPEEITDFQKEQMILKDMVEEIGLEETYVYFKENYYSYDPDPRHYLGHFIGDEAYKELGTEGLSLCDSSFDYGCVHGFMLAGVRAKGEDFLSEAVETCKDMSDSRERGSCVHGLSHTILYLDGYRYEDLLESLSKCEQFFSDTHPGECYNAVFMEYNLRSVSGGETGVWFKIRELDDSLHEPCGSLDVKYQPQCYIEQVSWWSYVLREGDALKDDDFLQMGRLCGEVNDKDARYSCFWGIGRIMSDIYKHDIEKIGDQCRKMHPETSRFACIEGALVVLVDAKKENAYDICNFVETKDRQRCIDIGKENER